MPWAHGREGAGLRELQRLKAPSESLARNTSTQMIDMGGVQSYLSAPLREAPKSPGLQCNRAELNFKKEQSSTPKPCELL